MHYFHTKLSCQKPMLRQIERWVQNGSITKNGVLLGTTSFLLKILFSLRTCYKESIQYTNDPIVHIHTFCKRWSFIWGCFFAVSILKVIWSTIHFFISTFLCHKFWWLNQEQWTYESNIILCLSGFRSSHRRCSILKKVFLKISQNSQENTCDRVCFLINFIYKETVAQVFSCKFSEIFKKIFFTEHLRATTS